MSHFFYRLSIPKMIILIFLQLITYFVIAGDVYISEIVAKNGSCFNDQFDEYPDWIEIHNNSGETINLQNWALSDNIDKPQKWLFPSISLASNAYLVVFASGRDLMDTQSFFHTNFKLSASGECLILSDANNEIVSGFQTQFPIQYEDVSYAWIDGEYKYMQNPTPQEANTSDEFLASPGFSQPRGVYSESFKLTLNSYSKGAKIIYTSDGSAPTLTNGKEYSNPITISKTTIIRAACVQGEKLSSSLTCSYIFPADVLVQSDNPEGYPYYWGSNVDADYGMDKVVCAVSKNRYHIKKAISELPIVSVTTGVDHLFSNETDSKTGGIYANPKKRWERPASIEIMEPENKQSIQANCGINIQGGASRIPDRSPKHSLRMTFKSEYGPTKLKYDLFDEKDATESFNCICLKAGYNNSWIQRSATQRGRAQYIRDVWVKATYKQMGNLSLHTEFVNLFVNGMYWGLYNISERIDGEFMESYEGGDESEYDVVKDNDKEAVTGSKDHWNTMLAIIREGVETNDTYNKLLGKNADGSDNPNLPAYLNAKSLADYMLLNFYCANLDWDHHNWAAARHQDDMLNGFCFIPWDQEQIFGDTSVNILDEFNVDCPSEIFQGVIKNEEFRLLFADRINQHLLNEGCLTPEQVAGNWIDLAYHISDAVYGESARWGDYRRDVDSTGNGPHQLYTVDDWETEKDRLLYDYFPYRTDILLNQLRDTGWYPAVDAPMFSRYGGEVTTNFELEIFSDEGDIYYTIDGSDPRTQGSDKSAEAIMYNKPFSMNAGEVEVKARVKSGQEWSALTKAVFDVEIPASVNSNWVEHRFIVAPNPVYTTAQLMFSLPLSGEVYIDIQSIKGGLLMRRSLGMKQMGENSFDIDVSTISNGMYICTLKCENHIGRTKMLICK